MTTKPTGTLFIVATPLGNLQDISFRAVSVLQSVDWIAAEDTRHSLPLLRHFSIKTRVLSLHEHNEADRTHLLIHRLQEGESIALISDAGTPLIHDPGYLLVKEARALGICVTPIPGACAAIAALSVAGLPASRFVFEGFLPKKPSLRKERLKALITEDRTLIFYESPHRIMHFLQEACDIFGQERRVVLARELTKLYETVLSGTVAEVQQQLLSDPNQQRGEFVVILSGQLDAPSKTESVISSQQLLETLVAELPLKRAVEIVAQITGDNKNALYREALKIKQCRDK